MLTFNPETHVYKENGVEIPSVTQIVRFLNADAAAKADPWRRDTAADRGSRVHSYCMLADYEELPDVIDVDCVGYVSAYLDFLRDYNPVWEVIEGMVSGGDPSFRYAGTVDRYGDLMGLSAVVDIKTGSSISKLACGAQLFGYATSDDIALRHKARQKPRGIFVLHLRGDGTYRLIEYNATETSDAGRAFWSCMEIHHLLTKKGRKQD